MLHAIDVLRTGNGSKLQRMNRLVSRKSFQQLQVPPVQYECGLERDEIWCSNRLGSSERYIGRVEYYNSIQRDCSKDIHFTVVPP